jgi:hypothetical protein
MKPNKFLFAASVATFLSSGHAADKPKTFALVPVDQCSFIPTLKRDAKNRRKTGRHCPGTGPNIADEAEQVQI